MSALLIVNLQCFAHLAGPQSIFEARRVRWKEGEKQTQGDNFLTTAAFLQQDACIRARNSAQQAEAGWVLPFPPREVWETERDEGLE